MEKAFPEMQENNSKMENRNKLKCRNQIFTATSIWCKTCSLGFRNSKKIINKLLDIDI